MATETTLFDDDESEFCILCSTKHDRIRSSFCQCKHCSIPLCLDCMNQHHNEVLQNSMEISHQYNEIQHLLQTKQKMINDEITKSIEDINQYFDTYIIELRQTQQKIIQDLEAAKEDTQNYLLKVNSDLHILGIDIQALAKGSVVQMTKMKNLSTELERVEQHLNTYEVIRTKNLIKAKPEYSIKYKYPSIPENISNSSNTMINESHKTKTEIISSKMNELDVSHEPSNVQEYSTNQPKENGALQNKEEHCWISDDHVNNNMSCNCICTSYHVDRMASDGKNILYTSSDDKGLHLIAYRYINDNDYNHQDEYRKWKQSPIEDMIWWSNIEKFICATNDAIYTVDYLNRKFRILCTIRDSYSYIRVAANTNHFFTWVDRKKDFNGIEIYSTEFQLIRTIDFNNCQIGHFIDNSSSFCVTDNIIASICTRMQNNREVFQVTFYDLAMNQLYSVPLGRYTDDVEIRTDGKNRFFISTGHHRFYIVYFNSETQAIKLQYDGDCIAVLDNRRIAISNGSKNIELIPY